MGQTKEFYYTLFYSQNEEDKRQAEKIHEDLKHNCNFNGVLWEEELLFGSHRLHGAAELVKKSYFAFFFVTDNLVTDTEVLVLKDAFIWDEIENAKVNVIPLTLRGKRLLKRRDSTLFAGLMSKPDLNYSSKYFKKRISNLKSLIEKRLRHLSPKPEVPPVVQPAGNLPVVQPAGRSVANGGGSKRSPFLCAQDRVFSTETDDIPSMLVPSKDLDNLDPMADIETHKDINVAENQVASTKSLLGLLRAFNSCGMDDLIWIVDELYNMNILEKEEKAKWLSPRGGSSEKLKKEELLEMLISKNLPWSQSVVMRLFNTSVTYRHKERVNRTAMRTLYPLLQLKIQNTEELLAGLWSGEVLHQCEYDECARVLERSDSEANGRMLNKILQKEERLIERALEIIKPQVTPTCREHIYHTQAALKEGKAPPDCCTRLQHLNIDDVDGMIRGPYQSRLKTHLSQITENLSDIEELMDELWSREVISLDQYESLSAIDAKMVTRRARKLVMEIYKQDEFHVEQFVKVLREVGHGSYTTIAQWIEG